MSENAAKWWQTVGAWGARDELDEDGVRTTVARRVDKVEGDIGAWMLCSTGKHVFMFGADLDRVTHISGPPWATPPGTVTLPQQRWAIVEVMGHRTHYGTVEEIEIAGQGAFKVRALVEGREEPEERVYFPGAIFCITYAPADDVRKAALPGRSPCGKFESSTIWPDRCRNCGNTQRDDERRAADVRASAIYRRTFRTYDNLDLHWDDATNQIIDATIDDTGDGVSVHPEVWALLDQAGLPTVPTHERRMVRPDNVQGTLPLRYGDDAPPSSRDDIKF